MNIEKTEQAIEAYLADKDERPMWRNEATQEIRHMTFEEAHDRREAREPWAWVRKIDAYVTPKEPLPAPALPSVADLIARARKEHNATH